jgi:hypothetical protein
MIPPGLQWVADELDNWGRWGRQHGGPHDIPEPSIWDAWLNFKGRIAGWGLTKAEQEAEARGEIVEVHIDPPLPSIDEYQAEGTDRKLLYLRDCIPAAYAALHKHWYKRKRVRESDLHEAMRHFADLS